jgi:hypothetical protein
MSCGVNYQFSLVDAPRKAEVIGEDPEQRGTPREAQEAGPADPPGVLVQQGEVQHKERTGQDARRADAGPPPPERTPRGRRRQR